MELISQNQPKLKQIQLKIANLWQSLTTAEKLYSGALLLLALPFSGLQVAAFFTLIGLTLEFWPRFARAWDSLAGKAFILLFYATITNFALALSAAVVNEVTGVSANHFNYTHNFALLLILPVWVIGISLAALLLFQIAMPFYLFLLLVLKPFGIKLVRLFSKSEHPLFTNSIRFVASFAVIFQLMALLDGEQQINKALAAVDSEQPTQLPTEQEKPKEQQQDNAKDDVSGVININFTGHSSIVKSLIAQFAYNFEADIYSRCKHPEGTRSIELNDYEVLHINKADDTLYGFQFTVKQCVSPAFPMEAN